MRLFQTATLIAILFFTGCTAARIDNSWTAAPLPPANYQKILVLGIVNEPGKAVRQSLEGYIFERIKKLGYVSACSCDEYGEKPFEELTEEEALLMLKRSGIDAVLTVTLLDKKRERFYSPQKIYHSPYAAYQERFWSYYSALRKRVYKPGYHPRDTRCFWETSLFRLDGRIQLVYSAQSRSFGPDNIGALLYEYSAIFIQEMQAQKILMDHTAPKKPAR